jgi:oxygen-independent coproporphyrinogen-3 oxidase
VYWANHAYFGLGLGAARYQMGRRELNTRDLSTYLRKVLAGKSATFQSEELSAPERARETLALGLRRTEGVARESFRVQTGFDLDELVGEAIPRHVALGMMEDDGTAIRLTRKGKPLADAVIEGFL